MVQECKALPGVNVLRSYVTAPYLRYTEEKLNESPSTRYVRNIVRISSASAEGVSGFALITPERVLCSGVIDRASHA